MIALLGWSNGFIAARNQIQLEFINSASVLSGGNIAHPSDILEDDLLIYIAFAGDLTNNDPPTMAVPSGYTQIISASATPGGSSGVRVICAYKIAAGTEDGSSVNISSTASSTLEVEVGFIGQFRPTQPIGTITIVDTDAEMTINDPSAQTQGGTDIDVSLHFAFYWGQANPTTRSYSPTEDDEIELTVDGTGRSYVRYKLFNPPDTAVAVTVNMGDHSNNALASFSLLAEAA